MLKHVEPYSKIMNHAGKVLESCRTELQLENAYGWATGVLTNFFDKVLAECRHGDVRGIMEIRDRSFMIFQDRHTRKIYELGGRNTEKPS